MGNLVRPAPYEAHTAVCRYYVTGSNMCTGRRVGFTFVRDLPPHARIAAAIRKNALGETLADELAFHNRAKS